MPTYDEALATTIHIIKRHCEIDRPIRAVDHIQNDLGLDSLAVMEVVSDIELKFDVDIPTAMFDGIHTVDDITRTIVKLTSEPRAPAPGP